MNMGVKSWSRQGWILFGVWGDIPLPYLFLLLEATCIPQFMTLFLHLEEDGILDTLYLFDPPSINVSIPSCTQERLSAFKDSYITWGLLR